MIPNWETVKIGENLIIQPSAEAATKTYKIDFEAGRIGGFIDGIEGMQQAIFKILQTPRFVLPIYSWNYGTELEGVMGKTYQVFASEIKRVICEALFADGRITNVVDFLVTKLDKKTALVTFTAETIFGKVKAEKVVNI